MTTTTPPDCRPPNSPWQEMKVDPSQGGYLSRYYCESFTSVPVRAVTKPADNKADPNIETLTYGLFSTCSKRMRKAIVENGLEYIFFVTKRNSSYCVSGFYRIKWYCPSGFSKDDFCLAADFAHFVRTPVSLSILKDVAVFRGFHRVDTVASKKLIHELMQQPNAVSEYLEQIARAENFNINHTGFRYSNFRRKAPFDWSSARAILERGILSGSSSASGNSSPTGKWACSACNDVSYSVSLLKLCPHCSSYASLTPVN